MRILAAVLLLLTAACAPPARPVAFDHEAERSAPAGTFAPPPNEERVVARKAPVYVRPSLQPLGPAGKAGEPRVIRSFVAERGPRTQVEDLSTLAPPTEAEMTQALPEQRNNDVRVYEEYEPVPEPASDLITMTELDALNGSEITVSGRFSHSNYRHGILRLDNGLVLWLPHLDQFQKGDDWLKYVGRTCTATGVVQTTTFDVDGYRGPSLDLRGFYGPDR